ncbi:MAG: hypothetical protein NWE84_07340 [Candidatus Bathyarchaeota archaeon]|nr:hypothetical protein [Candidatus Bathyarchaeota archaeon]
MFFLRELATENCLQTSYKSHFSFNNTRQHMKGLTVAVAFTLTVSIVLVGTVVYPNIVGSAVTYNNNYVFSFFLATFLTLMFLGWIGEKIARKISKPRKKT